jgi:hypothetical protein
MKIIHRPCIAINPVTGERLPARQLVCPCGSEEFVVFLIGEDDLTHPHLQCIVCEETFCDKGEACMSERT